MTVAKIDLVAGEIPILDVAPFLAGEPGAAARLAAQLRWAFEHVGFYYLRGHGIDRTLIADTFAAAASLHALPMEQKLALKVDEHNIGYLPMSSRYGSSGRPPSRNEAFFLRRERTPDDPHVLANRRFHAQNRWPGLPGFRAITLAYMAALEALCQRLVRLYALALEMPEDCFDRAYTQPHMILRLSHYPPLDPGADSSFSLTPHTDSGFMTLLAPNQVPGLSIQLPTGRWIDAPTVPDAFVVNGGDILHRWSNERFLSTPHRVLNLTNRDRYAIPFFCDPDHDTVIECLPSCHSAENPAKYPPIQMGDYAAWFARRLYQHMAATSAPSDATIVPGARATEEWKSGLAR